MPKKGERTVRVQMLVSNFYDDRKEGMTPIEIANKYKVSLKTMYDCLQEIADSKGVSRNSLLQEPEHSGEHESCENPMKRERADLEQLKSDLNKLKEAIESTMATNKRMMEVLEHDATV